MHEGNHGRSGNNLHSETTMMEMLAANVNSIMDEVVVKEPQSISDNLRIVQETSNQEPD